MQGLGQGHFQIFLNISLKEFIKLNLNKDLMMRSVKLEELNTKIASVFLNTQVLNTEIKLHPPNTLYQTCSNKKSLPPKLSWTWRCILLNNMFSFLEIGLTISQNVINY